MTREEFAQAIRDALKEEATEVRLAPKWEGGTVVLKPGDPGTAPKEIPLDALLHKVVMIRDRLRVLEQKINANEKLTDAEKVDMQQYVTRCYGSLTTFNVLFRDERDQFVGEKDRARNGARVGRPPRRALYERAMQVKIARTAGFCWGVRRTVDKVMEVADQHRGPVVTLGPIIHNPQAVARFREKGVGTVNAVGEVGDGTTVVVRTHGAVREELERAEARGLEVVDGTCPYVKYPQAMAQRLSGEGYHVVIVGDANHAEVKGVVSYAEGPCTVVKPGGRDPRPSRRRRSPSSRRPPASAPTSSAWSAPSPSVTRRCGR